MKTFKQYFEENEKKWVEIINGLKTYVDKIRKEKENLLCKFKPSATKSTLI